jgi:hypothetical protein
MLHFSSTDAVRIPKVYRTQIGFRVGVFFSLPNAAANFTLPEQHLLALARTSFRGDLLLS